MSGPKFSNDPEQNAEMQAQYYFECRILGVNPYARDEYEPDEPGEDYGPDEEDDYEPEEEFYDDEE